MLNEWIEKAYAVLDGQPLPRATALKLAEEVNGADILDLASLANKVRKKFAGPIRPCSIINAKSGHCAQNCRFCAQAEAHDTHIDCYELLSTTEVLAAAQAAYDQGVRSFGYVTSGYGFRVVTPEFEAMLATFDRLHAELPELKLCVSIGILSRETARLLAEHHVWRYNMNLQTAPSRYGELITRVHSIEEKIQTIRHLQEFGVTICTGGIIGLGETWADRVEMAYAVNELDVDGIPLNVLLPIAGTPLAAQPVIAAADAVKAFAIFRLVNPAKMIKFAAGRETVMKDFQGLLMLSGLNSMITGGYLTTRGRAVAADRQFITELENF